MGFYLVLLVLLENLLGFRGVDLVLLGFSEILLDLVGFYRVLWGCTRLY